MSHRFFLSQTPTEDTARLEGDEARHLARVMRAKTGDTVELFDGQVHHGLLRSSYPTQLCLATS